MNLKVAVQMDPINTIDITGDSTFAMLLEAQKRGHSVFYYLTDALSFLNGRLSARGCDLTVRDEIGNHFSTTEMYELDLASMDIVLMRQDPPFDMSYITATHLLERIHPETLVVNDPRSVRDAPEKIFVTDFVDFMPPTLITRDELQIRKFKDEHDDIIVKPLYGNGGQGVFRLRPGDENLASIVELFNGMMPEPMIAQKYLPEVRTGDKRIILIDGEVAGAINRVPAEGETRSNMHVGGRPEDVGLTQRDLDICKALGPILKERGLIFVGIDVIGDYLTEINVTSPTGICEIKRFGGPDIAALIWDAIEKRRT